MTGSALFDFIIACLTLAGIVTLFWYALESEYISVNATFTKIARAAIGFAAAIAFLFALKAVFFGGAGLAISPVGMIYFAVGLLVVLVVMYLVKLFVGKIVPGEFVEPILFVLGAICLIALLYLAAGALFGGSAVGKPFLLLR